MPDGLIPPILVDLAVTCCETCQSHGKSYVDLNSNGFNESAKLPSLRALRNSIANPTDFFFPVYGFKEQTHFAKQFGYQGIVESPGMAYIVNTNSQDDMPNAILANISACWPAVMFALIITYLAGLLVWSVVSLSVGIRISIISSPLLRRGLFTPLGGWGEGKKEAHGDDVFTLPIVNCAITFLHFVLHIWEPLRRREGKWHNVEKRVCEVRLCSIILLCFWLETEQGSWSQYLAEYLLASCC